MELRSSFRCALPRPPATTIATCSSSFDPRTQDNPNLCYIISNRAFLSRSISPSNIPVRNRANGMISFLNGTDSGYCPRRYVTPFMPTGSFPTAPGPLFVETGVDWVTATFPTLPDDATGWIGAEVRVEYKVAVTQNLPVIRWAKRTAFFNLPFDSVASYLLMPNFTITVTDVQPGSWLMVSAMYVGLAPVNVESHFNFTYSHSIPPVFAPTTATEALLYYADPVSSYLEIPTPIARNGDNTVFTLIAGEAEYHLSDLYSPTFGHEKLLMKVEGFHDTPNTLYVGLQIRACNHDRFDNTDKCSFVTIAPSQSRLQILSTQVKLYAEYIPVVDEEVNSFIQNTINPTNQVFAIHINSSIIESGGFSLADHSFVLYTRRITPSLLDSIFSRTPLGFMSFPVYSVADNFDDHYNTIMDAFVASGGVWPPVLSLGTPINGVEY
jgi:hypothetical protein